MPTSTASPERQSSLTGKILVDGSDGEFRPVRYQHRAETCHLCWARIPAGAPGPTTGSRGTRAWFLPRAELRCAITGSLILGPGLWECIPCHAA